MKLEKCQTHVLVKEEYAVLVRCDVEIEVPQEFATIVNFYQKLTISVARWAEDIAGKQARKAYADCTDIWQKSRFLPIRFSLIGKAFLQDEQYVSVVCESTITRGSQKEFRRCAQVWNCREQTILPMRQVVQKWYGKKSPVPNNFLKGGCYPQNGKIIFFQNQNGEKAFVETEYPLFCNKK